MIVWLLAQKQRRYFYLAFAIIVLDLIIGPMLIAWEVSILKGLLHGGG